MAQESAPSQEFVDLVNRFGFQLQSLTIVPDKPTGLCAMNIYQCLMMVAAGSKDVNFAAFAKTMGFNTSQLGEVARSIMALDAYSKNSQAVELSSASSVWHDPGFILEKEWEETMRTTFGARLGALKLEPINSFIETATKGRLTNLVSASDLVGTVLMIVTCLYFKAKWETPFEKTMTQKAPFMTFENKKQTCHMMHRVAHMFYKDDNLAQICILPYKTDQPGSKAPILDSDSSSSSMEGRSDTKNNPVVSDSSQSPKWKAAIILPKEHGLQAMQNLLQTFSASPSAIRTFLSSAPGRRQAGLLSLSLPRFTLKLHHDLIPPLTSLGLGPAFSPSDDFSPISNTGALLINRVTHDLFIEVNEEGTEMAAVTIVSMGRSRVEAVEMKVDRPFLFVVFDADTGLVMCSVVVSEVSSAG